MDKVDRMDGMDREEDDGRAGCRVEGRRLGRLLTPALSSVEVEREKIFWTDYPGRVLAHGYGARARPRLAWPLG